MELRTFLQILTRRLPTLLTCLALGAAAAWAATSMTRPTYEARTQLFVATHGTGDTAQLQQGQSFSQARVQSYAAIVNTRQVTEPVVRKLRLAMTPEELAGHITAKAPLNTVLIDITVTDGDAERAARIADAVATRFGAVVERLEAPRAVALAEGNSGPPYAGSPVTLGVTQQAAVPTEPVSPRPALNLAAGLLGGLLVGAALAFLRESLDTTVKSAEATTELTGVAPLASVPYDKEAPGKPLAVGEAARTPRADAFRRLRANLQFAHIDDRPRVIAVTSSLPGEGKTNTAANLALSLAEAGVATCLVDADLRKPCVAKTLGLVQDAGLTTVLIGRAGLDDVMQHAPHGLAVLTGGTVPPNPSELLASERMGELLRELADRYETVIVDTAPLLPVADTVGLAPLVQGTLLVVRAGKTSRDEVTASAGSLRTVGARLIGTVFSMAPVPRGGGYGGYGSYGELPAPRPGVLRSPARPVMSYLAGDK
ncbi:polysaccharide biosynthesis tyrosine autokinase [Streptomyces sp. NPDC050095]|uniref:polysaccharide biosynthesis tyrosine autokinase n=1 Tax=unclassified Streptomyces TaxID=2593676 RepID=UPI003412EACD